MASKFFFWHVETSVVNPGENVSLKAENFWSMTESDEKIHKNIFFSKGSYRHEECNFDNPSEKFLTNIGKRSTHCPKMTEKKK